MLRQIFQWGRTLPYARFSEANDETARRLTKVISQARSLEQLKLIICRNQGSLNLFHMSAVLKKLKINMTSEQTILDDIYQQVRVTLEPTPRVTPQNARALANIIGYTGNRGYTRINDTIKKIDYGKLLGLVNEKEGVMLVTGLLKLGILHQVIDEGTLDHFVTRHVERYSNFGLLVSLWRNLIKAGKCTQLHNKLLLQKIVQCRPTQNIKDLGYLLYCYTESPFITQQIPSLTSKIVQCSEQYLYSTRINVYELCIFVDHLVELAKITKLEPTQDFVTDLLGQYTRIVRGSVDLRSLANGFMSLVNFRARIGEEAYTATVAKFKELLKGNLDQMRDYQSVTSLFLQLVSARPDKQKPSMPQLFFNSIQLLTQLIQPLRNFLFNPTTPHIVNLSPKQLQKLLYSLHLCKKQQIPLSLTPSQTSLLTKSLLSQNQPTDLQLTSMIQSLNHLGIRDETVCAYVMDKMAKDRDRKIMVNRNGCWLGLKKGDCLGCGHRARDGTDSLQ